MCNYLWAVIGKCPNIIYIFGLGAQTSLTIMILVFFRLTFRAELFHTEKKRISKQNFLVDFTKNI